VNRLGDPRCGLALWQQVARVKEQFHQLSLRADQRENILGQFDVISVTTTFAIRSMRLEPCSHMNPMPSWFATASSMPSLVLTTIAGAGRNPAARKALSTTR